MRTVAALAALATVLVLLPGCPADGFGCGGDPDPIAVEDEVTMLRDDRGDALVLCANKGYAATLADGRILEGFYDWWSEVELRGYDGPTDEEAFVFTLVVEDGSLTSPTLGAGWHEAILDEMEHHYASIQCADLPTRAWWAAP